MPILKIQRIARKVCVVFVVLNFAWFVLELFTLDRWWLGLFNLAVALLIGASLRCNR